MGSEPTRIYPTIQELPAGWQVKELGTFCTKIGSGATPRGGSEVYLDSRVSHALIRSQNVFDRHFDNSGLVFITDEHARELQNAEVRSGDVLLNITGDGVTFGRSCIVPDAVLPACVNQHVSIIRVDPRECEPGYLLSVLTHPATKGYIESFNSGGSRRAITKGHIQSFEIPLPPLPEQRFIAEMLGTLDNLIELNRCMNRTLEATARAIFKAWFVDFDPVRTKMDGRIPQGLDSATTALFSDGLEHSDGRSIPKGWHIETIRELSSNVQYGLTQSASTEPVGPRFLRITDIQGGRVDWSTVPYCRVAPEEHERYRLKPGDVLVARTGASTGENIYLSVVPDAVFASYLVRFQFADPAIARLVGAFMRTGAYFDFVAGSIGGSAQPNASAQILAGAEVVVPTPEVAHRFAEVVAPLDRRIAANNDESRTLATLRDTLLPRLISGKIRMPGTKEVQDER